MKKPAAQPFASPAVCLLCGKTGDAATLCMPVVMK